MSNSQFSAVHKLFEQQVLATPDALAIVFESEVLSYEQLNTRANRLANHLLRLGVSRGDLVGVCLQRSPELIVALLGILKAGAAYVPLDPEYPRDRLAFMVRDTSCQWVLTHRLTSSRLEELRLPIKAVDLDTVAASLASGPASNPVIPVSGDDLIYVMYTSGSTGQPKGVLVCHRGVVRLVRGTDYCSFEPDNVFLLLAPLTFDASTFEIWGPLLNGACLAIMHQGPPTLPALEAAILRHGVTTLWLTAGLFHLVVEQRIGALAPLRQLVAGGDVLSPRHVQSALEAMRNGVIINGYGPTESTTFACCFRMEKGYQPGTTIPIGRAIANTSIHILDEQTEAVAAGTPGELFIGGAGLARGYLNNEELTRERFIPDPFRSEPDARLYRTGDRVRELSDGTLEFLGRLDDQVKILGHRIEPSEIEAVLSQHPGIRQAVVVARPSLRAEKHLVAYVVPENAGSVSSSSVQQFLSERLPHYMVPSRILQMDSFSLNLNGKVDRSALPWPEPPVSSPTPEGLPIPELEQKINTLWGRILQCPVGRDDNFFDLGGTSLHLIEVHSELSKLFVRELPLTEFFEHSTVRTLANSLAGKATDAEPVLSSTTDRALLQRAAFARRRRMMEST